MPESTSTERAHPFPLDYEHALMDLSVVLAHRLRGLVASIEGFTDLLADTLGTREQRELALRIFEGAARIEHILADLQLYSRPIEVVHLPLCPRSMAEELLAVFEEEDLSRISIACTLPEEVLLNADPQLLRQALLVLVQNALEATPDGPVSVRIRPAEAGGVRFEVWNRGMIPLEEAAAQVFRPFFTTKAQNLGLGLAIARRIVEAHGGKLYLALNDPAEGTCFALQLPAASG